MDGGFSVKIRAMTLMDVPKSLDLHQHIVLDDVPWQFYEHLLEVIGNRPIRVTFDEGRLEMMAPLQSHEHWKAHICRMVEAMCLVRRIPICLLGSTTFRREDRAKGLEPDGCYYVQHALQMGGKTVDMSEDPPPDLALEIDITSRSVTREPVYAGLGIPELWRYDGKRLTVLKLSAHGKYRPVKISNAFPFLKLREFERFLQKVSADVSTAALEEFVEWVKSL